jgi:transaldolase
MVNKDLGFSLWLDFIERDYLKNDFEDLVKQGIINGATSNPSIFANAINTSKAYKEQLDTLADKTPKEKYEALAIKDIKTTAQKLRSCYDENNDGYISIEVDPFLSNDTEATIEEAKRLFKAIDEPNVMVKIPATKAGYKAMSVLLNEGISVNATLIFSPTQAQNCIDAMNIGLSNSSKNKIDAVISVFVSRFDRLLDSEEIGIMNASKIYNMVKKNGKKNIRTLFASTGVKGNNLNADYYIKELFGSHCINTAPLATIEAYITNPQIEPKLPISQDKIDNFFKDLESKNINMEDVYNKLLNDGLEAFEEAFSNMLSGL